jgi:predicted N-acetyltransferase YhbS
MMHVRECTVNDFEKIHHLNSNAFGYEYNLEKTKNRLSTILNRETDKIYVACVDDTVVGYIHGSDYECTYCEPLKNIMAIAVDGNYRNLGIGKALLSAIEDWAQQCHCCGVRLVSGFDRTGAHKFYLRSGYILRKQQKNFIKFFPE